MTKKQENDKGRQVIAKDVLLKRVESQINHWEELLLNGLTPGMRMITCEFSAKVVLPDRSVHKSTFLCYSLHVDTPWTGSFLLPERAVLGKDQQLLTMVISHAGVGIKAFVMELGQEAGLWKQKHYVNGNLRQAVQVLIYKRRSEWIMGRNIRLVFSPQNADSTVFSPMQLQVLNSFTPLITCPTSSFYNSPDYPYSLSSTSTTINR